MPPYITLQKEKPETSSVIPRIIYQTWFTKGLPKYMNATVENLKGKHPTFTHYLFDDKDCREFIKEQLPEALEAYDNLIPGAYKADLWRYCCLYKTGGIYLDIKFNTAKDFNLESLLDNEYYVADTIEPHIRQNKEGIYNAFIVSKPDNPILKKCIEEIIVSVKKRQKGPTALHLSGPQLMAKYLQRKDCKLRNVNGNIYKNSRIIVEYYLQYRTEQHQYSNKPHYSELWNLGKVFK